MKKIFILWVLTLMFSNVCNAMVSDGVIYTLDKTAKTATVTGVNKSGEVTIASSVWYYNFDSGKDEEYIVTSIAANARDNYGMSSLTIPNTVTSIGENAFSSCTNLVSVSFPESITSIESGVLRYCPKLERVVLPSSLVSIANDALCSGNYPSPIHTIVVSDLASWCHLMNSNRKLSNEYELYVGEELVTDITVPSDMTTIKSNFYSGCVSLTSLTIPDHVTTIGEESFTGCLNVKSLIIPSCVTTIGNNAFSDLQLETLELHTMFTNTSVDTDKWWPQSVDKVIIGNDVTSLSKSFYQCHMNSLYIPNSIQSISSRFGYESGHTNGCEKPHLSEVHITDLATWCNISFSYGKVNSMNGYVCTYTRNPLVTAKHLYLNDTEITDLNIPSTVTTISDCAFQGGLFDSVFIPNSVTKIGLFALQSTINSIEFHSSEVERLRDYGITDAETIIIGEGVDTYNLYGVGDFASLQCVEFNCESVEQPLGTLCNLPELKIGEKVREISAEAFSSNGSTVERKLSSIIVDEDNPVFDSRNNCNAVIRKEGNLLILGCNNTILPSNIQGIGDNALKNCKGLTNVVIPNSVTSIGVAAFHLDTELTSVTLSDNLVSIGERAFGACLKLGEINLPESVTTIDNGAFYACRALTTVIIPPLVTTISSDLFSGANNLSSVVLPNSITKIEDQAFYNTSLASIVIGDNLTTLGNYAFAYCENLAEVVINLPSPLSISENVFSNRTNAILYVPKGSKQAYIDADYWNEFKEIREIDDAVAQGDVNDDGQVTAQDASLVLQAVAGKIVLSPSQISIADVNGDTSITAQDASLILQRVAGKIEF